MLENFLLYPFLALIFSSISLSILGVFALWKKSSYFSDALSHALFLGFSIGILFQIDQTLALILFSLIFSLLCNYISQKFYLPKTNIILIISYFCVATSMIIRDLWIGGLNFESYIFGDILTSSQKEVIIIFCLTILVILYSIISLKRMLLISVNKDLAKIDGIKVEFWNWCFLFFLSLIIALSIRIVGMLLITALLVLPASIARIFSKSPMELIIKSFTIASLTSGVSFFIAKNNNISVAALIIFILSLIFFLSFFVVNFKNKNKINYD